MAFDLLLKASSTSQIIEVTIRDSTTGQGKTGITPVSVTYSFRRRGAAAGTLGTGQAMTAGTWVSGGWCELDSANVPGLYQFGVPNNAIAAGVDAVTLRFKISGAIDKEVKIVLTAVDLQDAVAAGISRLDQTVGSRSTMGPADVWQALVTTYSGAAGSFAKLLSDNLNAAVGGVAASVWGVATRSLTDKTGFSLSSTQSFNNTGQVANVPANVQQFGGNNIVTTNAGAWTVPLVGCGNVTVDAPGQIWGYGSRTLTDKTGFSVTGTVSANVTQWNGTAVSQYVGVDGKAYPAISVKFFDNQGIGLSGGYPLVNVNDKSGFYLAATQAFDNTAQGTAMPATISGTVSANVVSWRGQTVANPVSVTGGMGPLVGVSDKTGFSLSATQSFDNTGQTTNLPANLKAWNGYTVNQVTLAGGAAAPTVNVGYWATYTVQADGTGFPLMYVHGSDAQGDQALRNTVWQAATASYGTTAGSFGKLLADDIDAKISSRLPNSGTISANVTAWNGYAVQNDGVSNYPLVFVAGTSYGGTTSIAQAVWQYPIATYGTTAGSFGKLMADNLDAKVSSVISGGGSLTAADVWGYATRTLSAPVNINSNSDITAIKAKTDNFSFTIIGEGQTAATTLDVNVTAWNGKQTYMTSADLPAVQPTNIDGTLADYIGAGTWRAMAILPENGSYGKLVMDNLDAKVSAIKAKTDNITIINWGGINHVVADTWRFSGQSMTMLGDSRGTFPQVAVRAIHADGAADLWNTATSTFATAGSVGKLLVDDLDAKISSRQATFTPMTAADVWSFGVRTITGSIGAVDANVVSWRGTQPLTLDSGRVIATAGVVGTNAISAGSFQAGSITSTVAPNLDAAVSSRMATFAYVAPDNAGIAAIKSQTDKLFFTDHGDGTYDVRSGSTGTVVVDNAAIATAVWSAGTRSLTDKAGFSLANGSISNATFTAGAIDATVAPNLDAQVSSRMASFVYVAPDNAGIAAIKAQTDQIAFTAHGDGTFNVRANAINNVAVDNAAIATAVWSAGTRSLTDKAGFSLANGSISTSTFSGGAIDATVAPNLDAAVSSRMASFVYVAPDNASIAAIKLQSDKLHFAPHGDGTFDVQANATATAVVDTDAVANAVWSSATRSLTDKAGFALAAGEYASIAGAVWSADTRIITGGTIDANKDKSGYSLAANQYTNIARAIWTDSERAQIRYALGLSGARKATDGDGVTDSIYRITSKLQFNSQSDVIASLDGETVRLNPMQNFNNIGQRDEVPAQESTLRLRLTDARAAKIDNLDTPVSTRSSHSPGDVWSFSDRTLTSFGTLVSDIAAAVWTFGSRTLTGFGSLVGDIWSSVSRTITGGPVDLSARAKADVKSAANAALVDFGPLTYNDAAFDRDQIIDQVEAVLAAVRIKPDAATIAAAVDALLTSNHGAGEWRETSHGVGPAAYTVRVTDGANPITMASVRLSVGPVGISLTTGADGTAAFDMQPGTYTLRIAKLGYSGHTATVTINANPADQRYEAQVSPLAAISAPPDPDKCTAYLTTYDGVGVKQSGVSIELRLVSPPPGNAQAFSAKPWTILSDDDGVVQVPLLKNAAYQARRGAGEWHLVKTTNADTIPLPILLSHPVR